MKKFAIKTASGIREINANEYSVAPKTNTFEATVNGNKEFAASTSGKGKSAIPNYYLYFRESGTLYYFRSNPEEIEAAKKGFEVANNLEAFETPPETPTIPDATSVLADEYDPEPETPEPETIGANEAEKGIGPVAPKRRRGRK